jgi:hypothetical protein
MSARPGAVPMGKPHAKSTGDTVRPVQHSADAAQPPQLSLVAWKVGRTFRVWHVADLLNLNHTLCGLVVPALWVARWKTGERPEHTCRVCWPKVRAA